jgi:branched-chain amino acid transport system permease protein
MGSVRHGTALLTKGTNVSTVSAPVRQKTTPRGVIARIFAKWGLSGVATAIVFVGFVLVPLVPGEFWIYVATEILILGLLAMSFNMLHGYMGQISFGHAAYFGLGAYGTGLLMRFFRPGGGEIGYLDFFLSLLAGPPVAAIGALVISVFVVRLTGIYFAILTLAFGELLYYIVFSWYSFTKGDDGVQGLLPPPFFQDAVNYYYFTLAVVLIATLLMWRILESPFGYTLRTLRDNQRRAAFLGINVRLHMSVNFVIAGTFAGVSGALWGPFQRSIAPGLLGWQESGVAVFMTLLGGSKIFIGPMVGSVIYTFLHAFVTIYTVYWPLTIGLVIMAIVLFAPGGVLGLFQSWFDRMTKKDDATADNAHSRQDENAP